ncbi:hypothetical protein AB9F35_36145, partial [Rhizobium leguminosarum]
FPDDPENRRIRGIHYFRYAALLRLFLLSSLGCAHVAFLIAVFRQAWFVCGVHNTGYWFISPVCEIAP